MNNLEGMTQEKWTAMTRQEREARKDRSGLCRQLIGLEGRRVRVTPGLNGAKQSTFRVGITTGWRPAHLAMRQGSIGSSRLLTERDSFDSVRVLT